MEKSIPDQLSMFSPTTSEATPSAISSLASASGPTHSVSQDGPTTSPSGPALAHASHSAPPEKEQDLPTSVTSGLSSIGSSPSAILQLSLESKLRARTASAGSTLYSLTWKHRATPSGRQICALRASAHRISASASGLLESGWATPTVHDTKGTDYNRYTEAGKGEGRSGALQDQAQLAGWPTPATTDHKGGYGGGRMRNNKLSTDRLDVAAQIAGPARLTATGEMLTGSTAGMESGGQSTRHIPAGSWGSRPSGTTARLRQRDCPASRGRNNSILYGVPSLT
jgi:hypothetical protein